MLVAVACYGRYGSRRPFLPPEAGKRLPVGRSLRDGSALPSQVKLRAVLRDAPRRVDPPPLEHGLEGRRQHLAVARRAATRLLERLPVQGLPISL